VFASHWRVEVLSSWCANMSSTLYSASFFSLHYIRFRGERNEFDLVIPKTHEELFDVLRRVTREEMVDTVAQ
jgi:hypothetical protein